MALLEVQDLWVSYGQRQALAAVTFSVERGEFLGVIGPNGSGKSTLVRTISGVLRPGRGRVLFQGQEVVQARPGDLARQIAVVPQLPALPEALQTYQMVLLGRNPYLGFLGREGSRDHEIVERAMRATGTWELASRLMGDLSGGERQRLVAARAIAQQPELLLLDEPTAHLDVGHQSALLDAILGSRGPGELTVLAVFHDLNLAAQYCPRLVLLSGGRIVADGAPQDVLTSEQISEVYGAEVCVTTHPVNGAPVVLPLHTVPGRMPRSDLATV